MTKATQQDTERLVRQEVYYNVSELMQHFWHTECETMMDSFENPYDYVQAVDNYKFETEQEKEAIEGKDLSSYSDCLEICNQLNIDACEYQQEILEYWLVSDWLADKLIEHGEPVAKDIHGLTVWGRTCSGQAIYMDGVIARIYESL